MRKMLVCCTSALGICGMVLSSDAMLVKTDRSGVQSQGALVPVSESSDRFLIKDEDLGTLSDEWYQLQMAFFCDLQSGGRGMFDNLLSRPLHSVCQFVADNVLSPILNSSDRSTFGSCNEFFERLGDLVSSALLSSEQGVEGRFIDKRMLADMALLKIEGLVPKTVQTSIETNMSKFVDAKANTLVKEEEFKQFQFDCDKRVYEARANAEIERIGLETQHRRAYYAHEESMWRDQRKEHKLHIKHKKLEVKREELEVQNREDYALLYVAEETGVPMLEAGAKFVSAGAKLASSMAPFGSI